MRGGVSFSNPSRVEHLTPLAITPQQIALLLLLRLGFTCLTIHLIAYYTYGLSSQQTLHLHIGRPSKVLKELITKDAQLNLTVETGRWNRIQLVFIKTPPLPLLQHRLVGNYPRQKHFVELLSAESTPIASIVSDCY